METKIRLSVFQNKLNGHDKAVRYMKKHFGNTKKFKNSEIAIIKNPIPDMIIVDFERKTLIAVEVSKDFQFSEKIPKYLESDFKKLILVKKADDSLNPKVRIVNLSRLKHITKS